MNKSTFVRLVLPLLGGLVCGGAAAQSRAQQPEPESYTYATYLNCDFTQQDRVDEIAEKLQKPIYDAAVTDGTITSWGWMAHHTGGTWRRVDYLMAPTLAGVLAASEKLNDQLEAKNKAMSDETGRICNTHDDYIWKRKLVSWSWMEHIVGGEYRRLEVLTGKDIPTLMSARTSLVEAMRDNPASTLLDEICTSHTDYLWDIKLSK